MDPSSAAWPSDFEDEARLIHESEWQIEMMRPFEYPELIESSHGSSSSFKRNNSFISSPSPSYYNSGGNQVISFGCPSSLSPYQVDFRPKETADSGQFDRTNVQVHQAVHVETERKRREKLNQGFIRLSSLLPNLMKLDKGSVLSEAASYIKQIQEQVKVLEQQTSKRATPDNGSSLSEENLGINNPPADHLPEVQVRISAKDVLIKVHCGKKQGTNSLRKVLEEIQNLNLYMINYNAMEWGKYVVVITILAKMNDGFSTTTNDLVRILQRSLEANL